MKKNINKDMLDLAVSGIMVGIGSEILNKSSIPHSIKNGATGILGASLLLKAGKTFTKK